MADLNEDKISHKGRKRHKYSPEVKKQAIAYAEIYGNRPASRHFQVDERRIREWKGKKIQNEGVLATRGNKGKQRSRLNWPKTARHKVRGSFARSSSFQQADNEESPSNI